MNLSALEPGELLVDPALELRLQRLVFSLRFC
jgi:hypothetical protein